MRKYCDELDPFIEAIADGTLEPSPDQRAHIASCARCASQIEQAGAIEQLLTLRQAASPPPSFTHQVMARVGHEQWKSERVIDFGFNLAMAAGVLVIVAGGLGAAWSLGLLTITIDVDAILQVIGSDVTGRMLNQVQTIAMAAVLLTMALVLWWWAEAASD